MISLIAAMGNNRVIGLNNDMPWHLPADLAYFKKVTTGHTIVMGRKTYESIGRPLPKRRNVILTNNKSYSAPGCEIVHSKEEIREICKDEKECFIIGGSGLFTLFWDEVDRLYVTLIHESFSGDTFFPQINEKKWRIVSEERGIVDEKNRYAHDYRV